MLILLWGLPEDSPLAAVARELQDLGVPTVLVNQRDILEVEAELSVGAQLSGRVRTPAGTVDLRAVTGVYFRPRDSTQLPWVAPLASDRETWRRVQSVDRTLLSWIDITPALVLNPLEAMASNNSKPYQLQKIRRAGFRVPDTLVTTDPDAVREFWELHGTIVYKSVGSTRSRVSRLRPERVRHLDDLAWCPTQFQQYIPGRDYRVHVVGSEVFPCAIASEADDYRYPAGVEESPVADSCRLPAAVKWKCWELAMALNLPLAGIDLRRTPAGEWYCFEVNPSPGFTYYEQMTGEPIAKAVAHLLARGKEAIEPPRPPAISSQKKVN